MSASELRPDCGHDGQDAHLQQDLRRRAVEVADHGGDLVQPCHIPHPASSRIPHPASRIPHPASRLRMAMVLLVAGLVRSTNTRASGRRAAGMALAAGGRWPSIDGSASTCAVLMR
jgi:hypothetical protein